MRYDAPCEKSNGDTAADGMCYNRCMTKVGTRK